MIVIVVMGLVLVSGDGCKVVGLLVGGVGCKVVVALVGDGMVVR